MSRKPAKASKSASLSSTLQLGRAVEWPTTPDAAKLDRVPNPQRDTDYVVRFTAPEFTSLCPVTGQPDFAHLMIDYVPGQWLLELKSLKLYIASFRNHGAFHEDCTVAIGKRIAAEIRPKFCGLAVTGIRAAAFRSMCSGRPESCPRECGFPIRGSRPIAAGDNIDR